jgi:hypothetical protein
VRNPVVVYTVRSEFDDPATRDRFVTYLREGHCLAVVRQGGALSGEVTEYEDGVVEARYLFGSQADYDAYAQGPAVGLRADVAKHFPVGAGMRITRLLGIRAARVPD